MSNIYCAIYWGIWKLLPGTRHKVTLLLWSEKTVPIIPQEMLEWLCNTFFKVTLGLMFMVFTCLTLKYAWENTRKVANSDRREVSGSEKLVEEVVMISTGQMRQVFLHQNYESVFWSLADFSICKHICLHEYIYPFKCYMLPVDSLLHI